ncbi:MAG: PEP-CTERM sorting domain-containing protein [Gemmatimonadaceae bacterium]
MRVRPHLRLSFAIAIILAISSPSRLVAQMPLTPGSWSFFEWFLGVGPVDGNGFSFTAGQLTRLRVTDDGVSGDAFDIFLNGALLFATPGVTGGVYTTAFDGDAAWAAPELSKGEIFLQPGQYTITLNVRDASSGFDYGEGFVRIDDVVSPPVNTVPEPATAGLFALGLFGIGAARWRSTRQRSATTDRA